MNSLFSFDPYQTSDWLKAATFLAIIGILTLIFFRVIGQSETIVSDLYFTEMACESVRTIWGKNSQAPRCGEFLLSFDPTWNYIRDIGLLLPRFIAFGLLVWGVGLILRQHGHKSSDLTPAAVGISSFLLGPVLLVNVIMKPGFGRPRPFWTTEFGHTKDYVLPGSFSEQCSGNCSFVSGEAAGWFWVFCIVPFLPIAWRTKVTLLLLLPAVGFSFLRVVFGRHYLSDITIAAVLSLLVVALCGWFFTSNVGRRWLAIASTRSHR